MKPEARRSGILKTRVGDDLVIYDELEMTAHRLNRTAALVWQRSDGATTVSQLARLLETELGLEPDEGVVWMALEELHTAGLLMGRLPAPPGLSRAEFLRRAVTVGAFVPVVSSLVAPTPRMAASVV